MSENDTQLDEKRRSLKVVYANRCPLSNNDAVTSSYVTPKTLFLIRVLFATYCIITLVVDIVLNHCNGGGSGFKYFTVLSFTGLTVYFMLSANHSYQYVQCSSPQPYNAVYRWIYWHLFAMNICYHIIVPLIFWTLLRSELEGHRTAKLWTSVTMHGGDFLMMAIDLILCNTMLSWIQLPVVILFALMYLVLAVVVHAIEGYWVYSFLDASKNPVVTGVIIPGLVILTVLLFVAGRYFCKLRRTEVESPIDERCVPVDLSCMTQSVVDNKTVPEDVTLDVDGCQIDGRNDATLVEIKVEKLH